MNRCVLMACVGLVTACGSDTGAVRRSDGCFERVTALGMLPADGGSGSSARATAEAMVGIWDNADGDRLTVTAGDSVTFHNLSGVQNGNGGNCAPLSFTAATEHVAVRTADGRLDESSDVDVRFVAMQATFTKSFDLAALHGTVRNTGSPYVSFELDGVFDGSRTWIVTGMLSSAPSVVEQRGGVTVETTIGKSVNIGIFTVHEGAAAADAGP